MKAHVQQLGEEETKVTISGTMGEDCQHILASIEKEAKEVCLFNLRDLNGLNSLGVKNWVRFFQDFSQNRSISFEECPSYFISQVNMIPKIIGKASVKSFFAEYYCQNCECDEDILMNGEVSYSEALKNISSSKCPNCENIMDTVEEGEDFLSFMKDR